MRKIIFKLHLWTALVAALPLLLVAVTGAFLVYGEAIDHALDPHLFNVTPGGERLPNQELLDRVRAAHPKDQVAGCAPPSRPDRSFSCNTRSRIYIYVNPYTGAILGDQPLETSMRRKLAMLHTRLMAGEVGRYIVIGSTIVSVFLIVSGLILWWKFKLFGIKTGTNWRRINFDLHSVLGLYAAPVFLALSLSGIALGFEGPIYSAILKLSGEYTPWTPIHSSGEGQTLSLDEAMAIGEKTLAGGRITYVGIPVKPTDVFSVYIRYPEDPASFGRSRVFVDAQSGAVLRTRSTRGVRWGQYLVNYNDAIHFGDIFGQPSRVAACLVSLFAAAQVVTGVLIWWKKG